MDSFWTTLIGTLDNLLTAGIFGIIALVIIVLGFLAYVFFKDASDKIQLASFICLLIGLGFLIGSIILNFDSMGKTQVIERELQGFSSQNLPIPTRPPKQ
jgi:putative Mn2+ efflux pump MntP